MRFCNQMLKYFSFLEIASLFKVCFFWFWSIYYSLHVYVVACPLCSGVFSHTLSFTSQLFYYSFHLFLSLPAARRVSWSEFLGHWCIFGLTYSLLYCRAICFKTQDFAGNISTWPCWLSFAPHPPWDSADQSLPHSVPILPAGPGQSVLFRLFHLSSLPFPFMLDVLFYLIAA